MHDISLHEGYPDEHAADIFALARRLGPFDERTFERQLSWRERVLTCLAHVDGKLAGYKIGYEERPLYFESWLGAVAPEFRRRGIARDLMAAQHAWAREQGFRIVSTTTEGSNHAMLIANLQAGFDVCGTFLDRAKVLKVILQKQLAPPA